MRLIGADAPPAHAMAERHEIAIASAGKRDVGVLLQEANDLSWDHDVTGYAIRSSWVKRSRRRSLKLVLSQCVIAYRRTFTPKA